jgi:hypothetical protein
MARARRSVFCVTALLAVSVMIFQPALSASASRLQGHSPFTAQSASSLHVVSEPVVAGKVVVVVNLTPSHTLELSAVDPLTDTVVWQMPYSTSLITPGVWPDPGVSDGVVVDFDPVLGPSSAGVVVQGINASTGAVVWRLPSIEVVIDEPISCAGRGTICIPIATTSSSDLLVLTASTGRLIRSVGGIERNMDGASLYETNANVPTFEKIGATGQTEWTKTVASFFGSGYTPNAGWDFEPLAGLDVGTVGVAVQGINEATGKLEPGGATENLGASKSVGIASNGSLTWTAPGMYQCGGSLIFLSTPVLCRFTGSIYYATETSHGVFRRATLHLEGFNPRTGAITWVRSVSNMQTVSDGLSLPFLDGTHLVVRGPTGLEIVNVSTGAVSRPAAGADYWCEHSGGLYTVVSVTGDYSHGHHTAAPTFSSCSASGVSQPGHPKTQPSTVGVEVDGKFVWLSSKGLQVEAV